MTEVTYIEWRPHVHTDLPSVEALWNDIWSARLTAKELKQILVERSPRLMSAESLNIAALIKYFRAFASGKRRKLKIEDAADLPPALRRAHDRLRAVRDLHIAHPVNRYEAHHVTISVAGLGTAAARATSVSTSTSALYCLSIEELDDLISLCDHWLDRLNGEKAREQDKLFAEAKKLTAEQLNSLSRSYEDQLHDDPSVHR